MSFSKSAVLAAALSLAHAQAETVPAPVHLAQAEEAPVENAPAAPDLGTPIEIATAPAVPVANRRADDLADVNLMLNSIRTLKAEFIQMDAEGTATGRFYLSRPGGLRFEYDPPRKVLIVANDRTIVVQENPNMSPYRARVDETPLRLLLKSDIDLAEDANITRVERRDDNLLVTAMETEGYGQGEITFVFSYPGLELREWVVVDPMGEQTIVTLSSLERGAALDPDLFDLPRSPRVGAGPRR